MEKRTKILIILLITIGISLLSYPHVSNFIAEHQQRKLINNYLETLETLNEERYADLYKKALAYNQELYKLQQKNILDDKGLDNYKDTLKIDGTDVMGFIEIPSINIRIPIYHGTDENVLQVGVGHYGYTSLPIGGNNTHAVLFGHSALPRAKLFTDLDKLNVGDYFDIGVLNQKLYYRIFDIEVIEPDELTNQIPVIKDKDLVTLVTCTPYGVNSHRLVITGERIGIIDDAESSQVAEKKNAHALRVCIITSIVLASIAVVIVIMIRRKKQKKHA